MIYFRKSTIQVRTNGTSRRARPHEAPDTDMVSPVKKWKASPEELEKVLADQGTLGPVEHLTGRRYK